MKKYLLSTLFTVAFGFAIAQNLKPSIGMASLPADNATVCPIATYGGGYNNSGYKAGDTIPHFQLFDKEGTAYDVLNILQTGKPLLLIGGSYTCPVFRQKFNKIKQIAATFTNQINVLVVYVVEAHPKSPDPSPYSGNVWTTSENQSEGILYLQPTTYGERKQIVTEMLANPSYTLNVPVVIDGPCNAWWKNYGPAPNNAYLIKPDGVVYKKHAWFDKNPDNMTNDINALLATTSVPTNILNEPVLYPNPAQSFLKVDFGIAVSPVHIGIYDYSGKKIMELSEVNFRENQIDVSHLHPGLYFYEIKSDGLNSSGKFIKE
jgi:hypothetical protein